MASCREALAQLERVQALAWWLEGAREGEVRPFTGGRPLQSATAGPHGSPLTGEQLLDARGPIGWTRRAQSGSTISHIDLVA